MASAQTPEDEFKADAARMGVSEGQIMRIAETMRGEETGRCWPRHRRVLDRFLAVSSQWRTASGGMGAPVYLGLDYASAKAALDGLGHDMTPDDWHGLQVMEAAAASAINEARA